MIDCIIFYGAGTKAGTLATFLADFDITGLRQFVRGANFDDSFAFRTNIVTTPAVRTFDPATGSWPITTPAVTMPGFTLWVATTDQALADMLWALPSNLCRVQLDRDTAKIIRRRPTLAQLRALQIDPVISGSNYDFATIADLP